MDVRRGTFRLWVVISVIWAAFALVATQPWQAISNLAETSLSPRFPGVPVAPDPETPLRALPPLPEGYELEESSRGPWEKYRAMHDAQTRIYHAQIWFAAGVIFLPPVLLFFLRAAVFWVVAGFRRALPKGGAS